MNNTHNIPYTALKTVVHRIIQQQPTNMQQLENIVGGVENQYRVPISLDNVNLTVKEVSHARRVQRNPMVLRQRRIPHK
jgi:uncharacterized protein YpuA (DUF1002 family)